VSESAVSAKRGWGSFGAKPAQSETPVGAAAKRRPPGRGRSEKKMRSRRVWVFVVCGGYGAKTVGGIEGGFRIGQTNLTSLLK
jgi:hypothetical protein